jgi:hypothetical protein
MISKENRGRNPSSPCFRCIEMRMANTLPKAINISRTELKIRPHVARLNNPNNGIVCNKKAKIIATAIFGVKPDEVKNQERTTAAKHACNVIAEVTTKGR